MMIRIHVQHRNRRPADRGESDHHWTVSTEVVEPLVPSWIEQFRQPTRLRIKSREIWPVVKIARQARQSQIVGAVSPTMLLRNDVLDLMWRQRRMPLVPAAILAQILCSRPDEFPCRSIHQPACRPVSRRLACACRSATKSLAWM